jgi:O-antigen ligase
MKRLWLYCFPLLFIPNFGFTQQTTFGLLEVSDWLIIPFILLLLMAPPPRSEQRFSQLNPLLWCFLAWALLSTLSVHFRYDYLDDLPILLESFLKLARLVLYVFAGILIARALSNPAVRGKWLWSLAAGLSMLSIGLLAGRGDSNPHPSDSLEGYKSYNVIIVSVAILCSYIVGLWIDNIGTKRWRQFACAAVLFAGCTVFFSSSLTSHGRGGWAAFAVGFAYLLWKRMQTLKTLAILVILALVALTAYNMLPSFKSLVDTTFSLDQSAVSNQTIDDGARVSTWENEAPKIINAPLLGSGFYHRGGESGLWSTGSHNFFIQMFLETGAVGGVLTILIFAFAWRHAGTTAAVQNHVSTATRAALITAVAGGMTGEYYYGGLGVLVLFAVLAIVGSLPTKRLVYISARTRVQPLRLRATT